MSASNQLTAGRAGSACLLPAIVAMAVLHLNVVAWACGFSVGAAGFVATTLLTLGLVIWRFPVQGIFLTLSVIVLGLMILSSPTVEWDARSIWFFHAKRVWIGNNLYAYLDDYAPWSHNDYPPMLAATAASLARSLARWNEVFPRLSVLILILPVLLASVQLLPSRAVFVALLGSLFVFSLAVKDFGLLTGYMDLILGLYYAAAAMVLARMPPFAPRGTTTAPSGTGWQLACFILFVSIFPMLKNEGILGAIILLALFAIRALRRPLLIFLAPLAFVPWLLVWKIPVLSWGVSGDLFGSGLIERALLRMADRQSLALILGTFVAETWPSAIVFLTVYATLGRRDPAGFVVAAAFFLAYSAGLIAIYLLTPHDLLWHLNTSASRVYGAANCVLLGYVFQELAFAGANSPTAAPGRDTAAAPSSP
jgi:hypothetical protein